MVDLKEWIKGITFTVFGALLFYFFWDNIFSNIITFMINANTLGGVTSGDAQILGAIAWVSFILIFLASVPVYFIYSIIVGSGKEQQTHPIEILKGIGAWCVIMPFLALVVSIIGTLIGALPVLSGTAQNIATGEMVTWSNADIISDVSLFGWAMTLITIIGLVAIPFFFILKGYGQLGDEEKK